jgi:hypothetical protein
MHNLSASDFVCAKCFNDEGLQAFVAGHAESNECDFCGAVSSEPIAAAFDDVVAHILACIGTLYDDPSNAGLPYESREGGWQGLTYSTDDIFDALELDFPNPGGDRLREAIVDALQNDLWSDAEPFRLNRTEQLRYSWDAFCRVIKHKLRFFFVQRAQQEDDELYAPRQVLELIFTFARQADVFVTMPAGTKLFRARRERKGQKFVSAGQLGPPPEEHATQTNRMSPPGIVMTYLADDPDTALAETANRPGTFAVATFVTERDALILDLTQLPAIPSVFAELPDTLEADPRPPLAFLHTLEAEISRPIARDDRVHIEYVPTQVVTEYIRTAVTVDGRSVDGIRYRSSRRNAKTAVVLFADSTNLILKGDERPELYHLYQDRWLRLDAVSTRRVSGKHIAQWA